MNVYIKLAEDEEQLNQLLAAQDLEEGEENEFQVRVIMYKTELQHMKSGCLKMYVFTENTGFL